MMIQRLKLTVILLAFLLLNANELLAQAAPWDWSKQLKSQENVKNLQIEVYENGDVYIAGNFSSQLTLQGKTISSSGGTDIFLSKYEEKGNLKWLKSYGGKGNDRLADMSLINHFNVSRLPDSLPPAKVLIGGSYRRNLEFGSYSLQSQDEADFFMTIINRDATIDTVTYGGGPGNQRIKNVANRGPRNIQLSGTFDETFTIGDSTLQNQGGKDVFFGSWRGDYQLTSIGSPEDETCVAMSMQGGIRNFSITGKFENQLNIGSNTLQSSSGKAIYYFTYSPLSGEVRKTGKLSGKGEDEVVDVTKWVYNPRSNNGFSKTVLAGTFEKNLSHGNQVVRSSGKKDLFILDLSKNGEMKAIGGSGDQSLSSLKTAFTNTEIHTSGYFPADIFLSGDYSGSFSIGKYSLRSSGSMNSFMTAINSEYEPRWAQSFTGTGSIGSDDIGVKENSQFFLAGSFDNELKIGNRSFNSSNQSDGFFVNFNPYLAQARPNAVTTSKISANVNPNGYLFNAASDKNKGAYRKTFLAPKDQQLSPFFAANFWIGGYDQNDQLYTSAIMYPYRGPGFKNQKDIFYGPVMNNNAYDNVADSIWNRTWNITYGQVKYHQNHFSESGYNMPEVIKNWPAHGDTTKGMAFDLAPFVDKNGNGLYEPEKGDYPKIKGDQAVYFINNDVKEKHTESEGKSMGIEIHGMLYTYNCPSNKDLVNTVFLDYKIVNRSFTTYDSVKAGLWADFDHGYAFDDYIGCDTVTETFFSYNGGLIDGIKNDTFYGKFPPFQAVTYLQNPMNSFAYFNNDFSASGNPSEAQHYYNYLTGTWKDGQPITEGANGRRQSNPETRYMYPGDPAEQEGWTEGTAGNEPGDRRGVSSSGPYKLNPGDTIDLELAFVYARDSNAIYSGYQKMLWRIQDIRQQFPQGLSPCDTSLPTTNLASKSSAVDVKCYPNPTQGKVNFDYQLSEASKLNVTIYNSIGKPVRQRKWHNLQRGNHNSQINLRGLPEGTYFYQFQTSEKISTGKVLLFH